MRRLRLCIELKDKNGFFVYEYQKENQKWFVYNAEAMIQIANAIEKDQTLLSINYQDQSYEIDLGKSIETNLDTKLSRKIHCVKSSRCFCSFFSFKYLLLSGKITIKCFHRFQQTSIRK